MEAGEETVTLRERKRRRTRRDLESAALRLFAERGYDATTVADIAAAAEVGPRTFFLHFATKEDVVLGDVRDELDLLADLVARRPPGQTVLELFREAGGRRVELFLSRAQDVRTRRALEDAVPSVHARAVALRETREREVLAPPFARELRRRVDHPHVTLMLAAFTGVSANLDALFDAAPSPRAARSVLDDAVRGLQGLQQVLSRR